jgi:hypothetical protein
MNGRERLLRDIPAREGFDRDEYPPAVGRGRGPGLERERNPRSWKADVRHVPSLENRSHGASLGAQLERLCNGTRFAMYSARAGRSRRGSGPTPVRGARQRPPPRIVRHIQRSSCSSLHDALLALLVFVQGSGEPRVEPLAGERWFRRKAAAG